MVAATGASPACACRALQAELVSRVERAARLPLSISVADDPEDAASTLVSVTAPADSGGGGRPRVLFDVTSAIAQQGAVPLRWHAAPERGGHLCCLTCPVCLALQR